MKPENEMTEEVRQLLDSLEEHGKNAHRQKDLEALIDGLSEERKTENGERRTFRFPLSVFRFWWVIGAAAAVLLLWLMIKPTAKETPNTNEQILVEKTMPVDSVKEEVEEVILEEPMIVPVIARSEATRQPEGSSTEGRKSNLNYLGEDQVGLSPEGGFIRNDVAEVISMESTESIENTDSVNIEINPIPPVSEMPITVQSPQRRVIRSLNLVCYECQKEPENWPTNNSSLLTPHSSLETTLFGQAKDPNMKNGAMTFELKLN